MDLPFGTRPIVRNIVASGRFEKELDLEGIYMNVKFHHSEYELETYPALLVKVLVNEQPRHVTLYKNGKYIIAGARTLEELDIIYDTICSILREAGYL